MRQSDREPNSIGTLRRHVDGRSPTMAALWRTFPNAVAKHNIDFLKGEQVVETLLLTNRSVCNVDVHSISRFRATAKIEPRHRCDFHVKNFVTLHRNENQHIFRAQEMSIHLRTVNIMLRHELETQKSQPLYKKRCCFKTRLAVFTRVEIIWCSDGYGQLIALLLRHDLDVW